MDFRLEAGNTPLDPSEAEGLIPNLSTQAELNEFEARNILEAAVWARTNPRVLKNLLDVDFLRLLHRQMFRRTWRWAGRYRVTQKSIGVEAFKISTELKNLVDDVNVWIEFQSYETDEIIARFHHRLVQIHPFPNGNGRHARLAADLLAFKLGIEPFSWGANSNKPMIETRQHYIKALQSADQHDYSKLLKFVRS